MQFGIQVSDVQVQTCRKWHYDYRNYKSPDYLHSKDLGCLHNIEELARAEMDDIYMCYQTYFKLTQEHIDYQKNNNGTTYGETELFLKRKFKFEIMIETNIGSNKCLLQYYYGQYVCTPQ